MQGYDWLFGWMHGYSHDSIVCICFEGSNIENGVLVLTTFFRWIGLWIPERKIL